MEASDFRAVVLGQLGEPKLAAAIESDIAGAMSHARALDVDTKGPLRDIHRRVGAAILFESSGGQVQKVAHLPELRFALGEPEIDTTSVDTAAAALEARTFFIRSVGSDGYQISHKPTLKKVVNDRRASLDDEGEVRPRLRQIVHEEFRRGATLPIDLYPESSDAISDAPRLRLVLMPPEVEWAEAVRSRVAEWVRTRAAQSRHHPGALIFCLKRPGRALKEKVETWLAWDRLASDVRAGLLGEDFNRSEIAEVQGKVKEAMDDARDEVWAGYTVVAVADAGGPDGLKVIDLGAGHASSGETLCSRILAALKAEGLLSESVGSGYIDRHWPPELQKSGVWPLASLRQNFLDGSLIRLLDAEAVLKAKIPEFVAKGELGLASGSKPDGTYQRVWHFEPISADEITFEHDVHLLRKERAQTLKAAASCGVGPAPAPVGPAPPVAAPPPGIRTRRIAIRISGVVPPEVWNRLGTKLVAKLRALGNTQARVEFVCETDAIVHGSAAAETRAIVNELGLSQSLRIEETAVTSGSSETPS